MWSILEEIVRSYCIIVLHTGLDPYQITKALFSTRLNDICLYHFNFNSFLVNCKFCSLLITCMQIGHKIV